MFFPFTNVKKFFLNGNDATQTVTTLTAESVVLVKWGADTDVNAANAASVTGDNIFSGSLGTQVAASSYNRVAVGPDRIVTGMTTFPAGSVIRFTEINFGSGHVNVTVYIYELPPAI